MVERVSVVTIVTVRSQVITPGLSNHIQSEEMVAKVPHEKIENLRRMDLSQNQLHKVILGFLKLRCWITEVREK